MLSFSLGPIALPVGPVLMLVAAVLASMVAEWVARHQAKQTVVDRADADTLGNDAAAGPAASPAPRRVAAGDAITASVLLGLLAARLGHLALNWQAYAESPASVIDIRDGGWNLWIGLAVGLAWLLRLGWRAPTQRPALAAGAAVGLVIWSMGLLMQQRAAPAGYPEVSLVALKDATPATLAQAARGRPVVVNLWASWCGPCRVEMPDLAEAQRRHPDIGFLFVNQGESADKVQAFLARSGLALDEVWLDQGSSLGRAIRSPGLPTTVFLDAQGRQVDAHFGVLSAASLQAKVEALRRRSAGR